MMRPSVQDPQATYRRSARRLRWRLRDDPAALQRGLGMLSRQSAAVPTPRREPTELGVLSPAGARFAALADTQVDADVLRYDARRRLLAAAAGMGVERFEANLVIALLQHRRRIDQIQTAPGGRSFTVRTVALLVAIEGCFLAAMWWIYL